MDTQELERMTDVQEMTAAAPKFISPGAHAVLDYMTMGTFFAVGFVLRKRHARASALAFMNGAAVLGATLFCDYPGGIWRLFSFKTHGKLDAMQATMAGLGPTIMGFAKDSEAQFFHGQAMVETGVIATTDFAGA